MEVSSLSEIRNPEMKAAIVKRTGSETPNPQGLRCPYCEAREVYASPENPRDSNLWSWVIRAFKVDDASECRNCGNWFRC
jgi:hypothetical protein